MISLPLANVTVGVRVSGANVGRCVDVDVDVMGVSVSVFDEVDGAVDTTCTCDV